MANINATGKNASERAEGSGEKRRLPGLISDFNMTAVWAGLTAFVWYVFGALPLHLEVAGQLGLIPTAYVGDSFCGFSRIGICDSLLLRDEREGIR